MIPKTAKTKERHRRFISDSCAHAPQQSSSRRRRAFRAPLTCMRCCGRTASESVAKPAGRATMLSWGKKERAREGLGGRERGRRGTGRPPDKAELGIQRERGVEWEGVREGGAGRPPELGIEGGREIGWEGGNRTAAWVSQVASGTAWLPLWGWLGE